MFTYNTSNFDIEQIAGSGQCFRMTPLEGGLWQIIAEDRCLILFQNGGQLIMSCSSGEFESFWREYFDLNYDYAKAIDSIDSGDLYLTECAKAGYGIRILKQNLWEMLITFMISQNNNIPRIKNSVRRLCEYAGEKKSITFSTMPADAAFADAAMGGGEAAAVFAGEALGGGEAAATCEPPIITGDCCFPAPVAPDCGCFSAPVALEYHAFPSPEAVASIPVEVLHGFGLGYRDEYIHLAAQKIACGEYNLDALKGMSYDEAMKSLMTLKGVGRKVADCVCLFGLHHIEAFPIDTHIKQILAAHYKDGFPFEKYKGYAGILQQYMFYADL
ncbi:MAG: 8-oxoguanine DNA glycosylase [Lachnospiraceae bacterium]|nr:8-oxoguanine DNA glycosylase [Lachnospiraceae bacterium]